MEEQNKEYEKKKRATNVWMNEWKSFMYFCLFAAIPASVALPIWSLLLLLFLSLYE